MLGLKLNHVSKRGYWWCRKWRQRYRYVNFPLNMMTYLFRVTGPLCGEFTGHQWIPLPKASDAELWCFIWFAPEQTVEQTTKTPVILLRRHHAYFDVIVVVILGSTDGIQSGLHCHCKINFTTIVTAAVAQQKVLPKEPRTILKDMHCYLSTTCLISAFLSFKIQCLTYRSSWD